MKFIKKTVTLRDFSLPPTSENFVVEITDWNTTVLDFFLVSPGASGSTFFLFTTTFCNTKVKIQGVLN
jgi:hypothetical protein